jgi:hypothetical protein
VSYPDLGCFAECLTCELCDSPGDIGLEPPVPDLTPDFDAFDSDYPGEDPFGLGSWSPPPDAPGLLDGVELPGTDLFGSGLDLAPGLGADPRFEQLGTVWGVHVGGSF